MTISDKIRIYELSRDLNLENKDILEAAQKLSISVKSHSSSITAEDARKIKKLINKKEDKKILSINKSSTKNETFKYNKEHQSPVISPTNGKNLKDKSNKAIIDKTSNKPEGPKTITNQPKNINKPNIVNSSQSQVNLRNQNLNNKPSKNLNQDKKLFETTQPHLSKVLLNLLFNLLKA